MKSRKYTEEQFIEAVKDNRSIAGVLKQLGLNPSGGNYSKANREIKQLNISIEHFTGRGWLKGLQPGPKRPLEYYLIENSIAIGSDKLRRRLIKEEVLNKECDRCKRTEWEGEEIPLELDHINGNHNDNRLENLRILCPNCHALTPTHRGRNQKRHKYPDLVVPSIKNKIERKLPKGCGPAKEEAICKTCKIIFSKRKCKKQTYCSYACFHKDNRKSERPPYEELLKLVKETNYCAVGRMFEVSDNSIRKWIRDYENGRS